MKLYAAGHSRNREDLCPATQENYFDSLLLVYHIRPRIVAMYIANLIREPCALSIGCAREQPANLEFMASSASRSNRSCQRKLVHKNCVRKPVEKWGQPSEND